MIPFAASMFRDRVRRCPKPPGDTKATLFDPSGDPIRCAVTWVSSRTIDYADYSETETTWELAYAARPPIKVGDQLARLDGRSEEMGPRITVKTEALPDPDEVIWIGRGVTVE